jgi:predicted kinase
MDPWLIALAGLPASGKSTVCRQLSKLLPAAILDKDQVRAVLFSSEDIEYSLTQDDFCIEIMLQTACVLMAKGRTVLLDGRPFSRRYQVERLAVYAHENHLPLKIIECVCPEAIVRQRLEQDIAQGSHLAQNRDFEMYLKVKAQAESIELPRLVVDTSQPVDSVISSCLDYIQHNPEEVRPRRSDLGGLNGKRLKS